MSRSRTGFERQWHWLSWFLVATITVGCLIVASTGQSRVDTEGERVSAIAASIRCPICTGQSVAESNIEISQAIRGDIRSRVAAGQTDAEILQAYVDRYGQSILLTPEGSGFASVVWIAPVVMAGLSLAGVGLALYRWKTEDDLAAGSIAELAEEDLALVARAREEHHGGD